MAHTLNNCKEMAPGHPKLLSRTSPSHQLVVIQQTSTLCTHALLLTLSCLYPLPYLQADLASAPPALPQLGQGVCASLPVIQVHILLLHFLILRCLGIWQSLRGGTIVV